jgi:type IV pilus assembly protein PilQ
MHAIKLIILTFSLFLITPTYAASNLSLDFKDINLADAIRIMAKFINQNVVLSKTISGRVTLHLQQANPLQAFAMLLTSQGLAKWQIGNIWFVASRAELIQRKQEELQWQTVWDASLPLKTVVWRVKYGKAEELARLLQDEQAGLVSKRGRVRVDTRTNVLCVQDTDERIAALAKLIKELDVPVKQIRIEARLASVESDFEQELGVDFSVKSSASENNNDNLLSPKVQTQQMGHYSIAVATLADGSLLDVKLAALENAGHAELISSPSLFTSNQQPASIEAGEEVPYQEVSESGGTAIVFKKAVLGLTVTPHVLPGNHVLLQLRINQDRPSHRMVLGMPIIRTRQITTNVLVKDGKTIVLGGIYETDQEEGQRRLPFISQIPVIGWLFKEQNTLINKRELLIFVTPKVITQNYE